MMENKYLEIELYKVDNQYCAYIFEDGSSGYVVNEKSVNHCAEKVKEYVVDAFNQLLEEV